MSLFGTFGTRGIVGKTLTPELAYKIGAAFGTFLGGNKTVVIGRDVRLSGEMLESAVVSGLVSTGCNIISIGIAPTPCVQFATKYLEADGGTVITASHNPPEYNGIKLLGKYGIGISKEEAEPIEKILFEGKFNYVPWNKVGKITNLNFLDTYNNTILDLVDRGPVKNTKLKVIVDPGNGTTCLTTPFLLQKLGCQIITLNSQLDGTFPGRDSEPTPENLKDLSKAVIATGSDLGIAHDGDGDRCVVVDENGNILSGDRTLAILAFYLLKAKPGEPVITTVATSQVIDDIAKMFGSKIVKTKVGDVYVSKALKEMNAYVGGEENGGVIYPEFVFGRDGTF
ncbi:MAG: phosphoglucosamine mutase, partial [Euryarchaeota archaeon]|nr:phosphoglucosamine mutase [Euryarchaeota archaeon]